MINIIFNIIYLVLDLYGLLLLVEFILTLVKVPSNRWTELLRNVTELTCSPARIFLNRVLPSKWQIADWSPIAVIIVIWIVKLILGLIQGLLLF